MRRWFSFVLLMPFQFIFGLIYSWGMISPALHAQSGWSRATLDLAFSLTPLALLPAVVVAGQGLRRMAPKSMLAVALACFTVGGFVGLASTSPLSFMLGYSILALGIGAGLSTAACIAMISRLTSSSSCSPCSLCRSASKPSRICWASFDERPSVRTNGSRRQQFGR